MDETLERQATQAMRSEEERRELATAITDELERRGIPDAEMLRLVMRMREAVGELDRHLERLQRYFTAGAPVQTPPS